MPSLWSGSRRRRIEAVARKIRLVAFDVDGVMTDGGIILIGSDEDARRFDVRDGMGVKMARSAGLKTAIISSRSSESVRRRAAELGMDSVYEGCEHKGRALGLLLEEHALRPEEVAYMGDDLQDLPVMERVGLPIAVADARPEGDAPGPSRHPGLRWPRSGARGDRVAAGCTGRDALGTQAARRGRLMRTAAGWCRSSMSKTMSARSGISSRRWRVMRS